MDAIPIFAGTSKNVLLLGCGFVARPAAEILDKAGYKLTICCRTVERAEQVAAGLSRARAVQLDLEKDELGLEREMAKNAVVISLVPYVHHAMVIRVAIRQGKHVVTTSYISPEMQALDEEARQAGITVLNEVGLDPGIDHLYAVKTITEVHRAGGRLLSFVSYCGGLPAPEASDNPLGYKFSWSPRGMLLALRKSAHYYRDDRAVEVPAEELMSSAERQRIFPGFALVGYPNRDSTVYRERYGIPEARTILRGTLRYEGFPEFVRCLADIGFLDEAEVPFLAANPDNAITWKEVTAKLLGLESQSESDLIAAMEAKQQGALATAPSAEDKARLIDGLRWLGLFSGQPAEPQGSPVETLCGLLRRRCAYESGERDMVLLQHRFEIEHKDGRRENRTATLVEYGDVRGHSAMARLVGVPCAAAVRLLLEGVITAKGVVAPLTLEIAEPLIKELEEKHSITMKEKILP